jgi:hypothetical protein
MNRRRRSVWRRRVLLGLLVATVSGCATMQVGARVAPRISAQNVEYDRTSLRFLLVVQSMSDGTTLDRRLGETSVALVGPPVACDGVTALPSMLRAQPAPPTSQDLVQLQKGESFSREVEMFLFETSGPDCIRARIELTNPRAEEPITLVAHARPTTP